MALKLNRNFFLVAIILAYATLIGMFFVTSSWLNNDLREFSYDSFLSLSEKFRTPPNSNSTVVVEMKPTGGGNVAWTNEKKFTLLKKMDELGLRALGIDGAGWALLNKSHENDFEKWRDKEIVGSVENDSAGKFHDLLKSLSTPLVLPLIDVSDKQLPWAEPEIIPLDIYDSYIQRNKEKKFFSEAGISRFLTSVNSFIGPSAQTQRLAEGLGVIEKCFIQKCATGSLRNIAILFRYVKNGNSTINSPAETILLGYPLALAMASLRSRESWIDFSSVYSIKILSELFSKLRVGQFGKLTINLFGPKTSPVYSAEEILNDIAKGQFFDGRVAILSSSESHSIETPLGSMTPPEILSQATDNIIYGNYITTTGWSQSFELVCYYLFPVLLLIIFIVFTKNLSITKFIIILSISPCVVTISLFTLYNFWFDPLPASLCFLLVAVPTAAMKAIMKL